MLISRLLQRREIPDEAFLIVLSHFGEGVSPSSDDDTAAQVYPTGRTSMEYFNDKKHHWDLRVTQCHMVDQSCHWKSHRPLSSQ